jgi:hypothetical protein
MCGSKYVDVSILQEKKKKKKKKSKVDVGKNFSTTSI